MAEIDTNKGYLGNQVYTGVVQLTFPALGWAVVIPAGATVDKAVLCRLPTGGGPLGASIVSAPVTGSLVTFRRQKATDKGYILTQNPQGTQDSMPSQAIMLHNYPSMSGISLTKSADNLAQYIETITQGKQRATYTGGQQDQYQGDVYTGDKFGPGIFSGRAMLTVKGSDMSYMEFSSLKDKIHTVTVESELDTLSDKQTITTSLNKQLKAANAYEGLGGRPWEDEDLLESDPSLQVKLKQDINSPLFRYQSFNGGSAKGLSISVIGPLEKKKEDQPVLVSDTVTFDGLHMRMSVQGQTSIKTAYTTGLTENPLKEPPQTEKGKKELEERTKNAQELLQKFSKINLSNNGLQRAAQIDAILNEDARGLIADMLGPDVRELINDEVEPFTDPYGWGLSWEGDEEPSVGQLLGDHQTLDTEDKFTGKTTRRFNNNSIITQDPDGSITLKDGWGSQITMSHGNIYISSALDTFIRPGRNLFSLVPGDISSTANGEMQLASKKHIKIGAEKNLVLASAISGKEGYTVLENRTAEKSGNTGMVIRSNGKLSLTSSDDMHIGINDKRSDNKGDAANYGEGSIFIEGQKVRIESRGELKLLGQETGLYACDKDGGTGIQLKTNSITNIAPVINVDTGALLVGKFQTVHTVSVVGDSGYIPVTLTKGSDTLTVQVRGRVQTRDIVCAGQIQASGGCLAQDYIILKTTPLETIPGVKANTIRTFRNQISRAFNTPLTAPTVSFAQNLQSWYNDNYICTKELAFKNDWAVSIMPTMCWQLQEATSSYKLLQRVQTHATGNKDSITCAYPGSFGWDSCKMFTLDAETFLPKYETDISAGYTTYTQKEN